MEATSPRETMRSNRFFFICWLVTGVLLLLPAIGQLSGIIPFTAICSRDCWIFSLLAQLGSPRLAEIVAGGTWVLFAIVAFVFSYRIHSKAADTRD
jgi:hypothetical protein